ncbi:MAG TPA: hypothetical protein VL475_02240 [Planctomycetaceae bacterium]|nr:hypothetical protein [Planctomycetaceae bacterium]
MGWSMGWDTDGHRTIHRVEEDEFQIISNPDAPAFIYAPPDSRKVVLYYADGLTPDTLYIHTNQVHITEFESIWSSAFRLNPVPPDEATFAPVVDNNWTVVGHLGWADGSNIVVPEHTIRNARRFWFLLQKNRLDGERQRLLDEEAQRDQARPFADSALVRANRKERPVSRPDRRTDTRTTEAHRGPLADRSIEDTYLIDLEKYVTGGGKASVGRNFLERGEALYLPMIAGVPDGRLASPKTLYSSGFQFLVLVDPEGRIQRVMDVRNNIVTYGDLMIATIELAIDLSMVIDIVPLAVVLLAAGVRIAERVMIRAVAAVLDPEAKALVEELLVLSAREFALSAAGVTMRGMAVSARGMTYAVEHVAGRTFILGEDMALMRSFMNSIPTEAGFYDLFIHGEPKGFSVLIKTEAKNVEGLRALQVADAVRTKLPPGFSVVINKEANSVQVWKDLSVREVADAVRTKLPPGVKLRLLSCDTGLEGQGVAQELANELNRTVWGADGTLYPQQVGTLAGGRPYADDFEPTLVGARPMFVPEWGKLPDGSTIRGAFREFRPQRGSAALKSNGGKVPTNEASGEINRVHPRPPGPGR